MSCALSYPSFFLGSDDTLGASYFVDGMNIIKKNEKRQSFEQRNGYKEKKSNRKIKRDNSRPSVLFYSSFGQIVCSVYSSA